jgi:hypothetical protein
MDDKAVVIESRIRVTTIGAVLQYLLVKGYVPKTRSELVAFSLEILSDLLIVNGVVKRFSEEESLDLYVRTFSDALGNKESIKAAMRQLNVSELMKESDLLDDSAYLTALNAEKKVQEGEPEI